MKTVHEPARDIPVIAETDVCVIGGGPGGLPAAWQAARHGAKTLLVEHYGFLGGMATAGLVGPILGCKEVGADRAVVGGITREFFEGLHEMGYASPWETAVTHGYVSFEAEALKLAADRMCESCGVDLLLHTSAVGAVVEGGRLVAVIVENKSGRGAIVAKCFVDATGDADVAHHAGADYTKGRPADGLPMAMGSCFHVGGIEEMTPDQRKAAVETINEGRAKGLFTVYGSGIGAASSTRKPTHHSVNATRFSGDATDAEVLTRGELYTREEIWSIVDYWREHIPGMEGVYVAALPPLVGIRETRQIVGEQRLTGQDVVTGTKREDAVARCSYWIDIHCPRGFAELGTHLCKKDCPHSDCYMLSDHPDQLPDELYPPDYFDIPYGALVPRSLDNLLVSGRCISADYQAMAAARVMGPCMAIGEACGVAAAMAADAHIAPRKVDVTDLRAKLQKAGAMC